MKKFFHLLKQSNVQFRSAHRIAMNNLVRLICVCVCLKVAAGEIISSIHQLESLVDAEGELLKELGILGDAIADSLQFLDK